ncbi:MAG: hypothetical protein ACO1SV_17855 [Fimbriimonas sp.]
MIAMLAFAALVYENPEPGATETSIQALVRIPKMDARDAAALEVLADVLPQDIEGYSRRDILTVTGGIPVRCVAEPDHLRIVVTVPPENVKPALSLLDAMLRKSRISDAEVRESIQRQSRVNYWSAALRPFDPSLREIRGQDVVDFYGRLVRPEAIVLAVGGRIVPRQVQEEWDRRLESWGRPRPLPPTPFIPPAVARSKNPGGITTLDLAAPAFPARDAALPARVLALVGLGTGKGSSLFRVARGKLGLSYRQEAVLTPTVDGFEPRLLIAMRPAEDEAAKVEALRTALVEDVKGWTESDRSRAIGMAEAVLLRATEWSPLSFQRQGPIDDDLEGRTFLRAYWPMKTGQPWNPGQLLETMRLVPLNELKEAATEIVATAKPRLQTGG